MTKEVKTTEAKHIFIDIESYTHNRSVEAQTDLISYLNSFVKESLEEKKVKIANVIFIPTGDGMCISLTNVFTPYDIHLQIALKILEKIDNHNNSIKDEMRKFNVRIGINENIDNLIIDINGNKNVSGSGINYAARIEGLCDGGQILIGNSVFEKLVQREKYMKSFANYSTEVKHGLPLKVHQYKNEKLKYLNNEIPSKFRPEPKRTVRLTKIQAYYIANCLINEEFISSNCGSGQNQYSLQTLFIQVAEDAYEKSKTSKFSNPTTKVKRPLQEHFNYIQSVDFWLVCDLNSYNQNNYLKGISQYFSEFFLFVNDNGKAKLKEDFPEIFEEYKIE